MSQNLTCKSKKYQKILDKKILKIYTIHVIKLLR